MEISRLNIQLGASFATNSSSPATLQQKPLHVDLPQDDQVTLSSEGQAQLALSNGQALHGLATRDAGSASATSEDDNANPIDQLAKQIKEMQQRLEEIRQEIAQLGGDKSATAEKQRDELEAEQRILSAQLMQAMTQKAKLEKMQAQG